MKRVKKSTIQLFESKSHYRSVIFSNFSIEFGKIIAFWQEKGIYSWKKSRLFLIQKKIGIQNNFFFFLLFRHGYIRYFLSCGIFETMGCQRSNCDHDVTPTNLWNIDHDIKNRTDLHGKTDVFWQTSRNVTVFRIYWISMSSIQESSRLLS